MRGRLYRVGDAGEGGQEKARRKAVEETIAAGASQPAA